MTLIIKKQVDTKQGFSVLNAYTRLDVKQPEIGNVIEVKASVYASKAAFKAKAEELKTDFWASQNFAYNRLEHGTDVLLFAHEKFKQHLIDTYKIEPVLNDEQPETISTIYFFQSSDIEIDLITDIINGTTNEI